MRVGLGAALLLLYPTVWRRRYRAEMLALLEDDPPTPGALCTLVAGATRAHLRPGASPARLAPGERARLSLWGLFCCWLGLSVAGACFQKETEEPAFSAAASQHDLLAVARFAVTAGAALGAVAIAIGGLPLLWQALRQARAPSARRALRLGLALPLAAIVLFAAVTAVLLAVGPSRLEGTSFILRLALVVPWWTAGAVCVAAFAAAPRLVLPALELAGPALRRAVRAGVVLVGAMALVTLGLAAYCAALIRLEPSLSALSGGPVWPSTGLVLGTAAGLAASCTALGAVCAVRAAAAARA